MKKKSLPLPGQFFIKSDAFVDKVCTSVFGGESMKASRKHGFGCVMDM